MWDCSVQSADWQIKTNKAEQPSYEEHNDIFKFKLVFESYTRYKPVLITETPNLVWKSLKVEFHKSDWMISSEQYSVCGERKSLHMWVLTCVGMQRLARGTVLMYYVQGF